MKVLLQDSRTSEYLAPSGRTKSAAAAHDFGSTIAALQFARKQGGSGIQILMKFDRAEFDLTLPVHSGESRQAHIRVEPVSRP